MKREEAEKPENEEDDRDGEHFFFSPSRNRSFREAITTRDGRPVASGKGLTMQNAARIERVAPESSPKLETRRTGVAFLCLIVATNFVPWMQLSEAGFDVTRPPSASETSLVLAGCLLAVVLVIASWLIGRRVPADFGQIARARDTGLLLALLSVGANLALATVLRRTAFGRSFSGELKWFAPVWFGLVLPTELAAGFFKGRASIPAPRERAALAGTRPAQ